MVDGDGPIARIRLARSLPRLLALPAAMVAVGVAVAVGAALASTLPLAALGIAAGAILAVWGVVIAMRPMTTRLDVEEAAIRLRWLGGGRTYELVAGPVTRVRFRGENASKLRARAVHLGLWQLGEATLRDEEEIHVVRLAPTTTAILVPTDAGRLAVAAADEAQLLDALTRAARARERQEAEAPPPVEIEAPPIAAAEPEPEPERPLTGIERAVLEQRRAEEAVAAAAAAAAEAAGGPADVAAEAAVSADAAAPAPAARDRRRRLAVPVRRPRPSVIFAFLPLAGAAAAWGVGLATGRMPSAGTDIARLYTLALVLAGPATSVGAIMALVWWPRIVGVVVAGGLTASLFIGRSLFG